MLLVLGIGYVEALGTEQSWHAILLQLDVVVERGNVVQGAGKGWSSLHQRQRAASAPSPSAVSRGTYSRNPRERVNGSRPPGQTAQYRHVERAIGAAWLW